jgi:spermidine/putrescine transport system substrate-binding protein
MQAELEQGNTPGYDLVVPTDSTVYDLVAANLLRPLNFEHISNFDNVSPQLKNPPYDPNNQFTVPYQWGTIGIGLQQTKVGKTVTSWNDLFTIKVRWRG